MANFSGFSKLSRIQKVEYIVKHSDLNNSQALQLEEYCPSEIDQKQIFSDMIENYIGNFPLPQGVVTNMLINGEFHIVPFVTEESSVVAAASKAAKYWAARGGFMAKVDATVKKGQVHFIWKGKREKILTLFPDIRKQLFLETHEITEKMRNRGGGITEILLVDKSHELPEYYQLDVSFDTADAMGANFINTCLEKLASALKNFNELNSENDQVEIIMSILSNYTPDSRVSCWVECPVELLNGWNKGSTDKSFAQKFKQAVDIANLDISRAVTHNKGIFNGVDAVLLATGNDWRATAAAAHAFASRDGKYKGLTSISLADNKFRYELEMPLAIGTVGGITKIHPMVRNNLAILKNPDAKKLMTIVAASGLANNFAAIASLITTGIQHGHMRMHLPNIFSQLNISSTEREAVLNYFSGRTISHAAVEDFIRNMRSKL